MATFTPGPLVSTISGTLAGLTFLNGPGPGVVQTRRTHARTSSTYQLSARATFLTASTAWTALTQNTREQWASFAAALTTTTSTPPRAAAQGRRLFITCYVQATYAGLSLPPDCPSIPVSLTCPEAHLYFTGANYNWIATLPLLNTATPILFHAARSFSQSGWAAKVWKFITVDTLTQTNPAVQVAKNLRTWFRPRLGRPLQGELVAVRATLLVPEHAPSPPQISTAAAAGDCT
jgi:hypothetical protein